MKRVADIVVETLIENGIDVCFSVVGGGAMHLNNAFIEKKDKIKTIYNHHEQACSMAAEGYATLRAYNSGNTVHTLMVFDGWGDTVRYLNFDFDS